MPQPPPSCPQIRIPCKGWTSNAAQKINGYAPDATVKASPTHVAADEPPSSTLVPEPCILCGCLLLHSTEKRYKKLQDVASLLEDMCVPTPYVHRHIANAAKEERRISSMLANDASTCSIPCNRQVACCIACINWVRRLDIACMKLGRRRNQGIMQYHVAKMPGKNVKEESKQHGGGSNNGAADDDSGSCCSDCSSLQMDESDLEETVGSPIQRSLHENMQGKPAIEPGGRERTANAVDGGLCTEAFAAAQQGGYECTCCAASNLHARHSHAKCLSKNLLIVPLDNLLLFLDNPGCVGTGGMHPDRRSMYRLMCGLVMSHTANVSCSTTSLSPCQHVFKNPYLMFCSPLTDRILRMFKDRYAPRGISMGSTASDARDHRQSGCFGASQALQTTARVQDGTESLPQISTPHFPTLNSSESIVMIDDIVVCWWESMGMPSVLQDREAACLVRRALRG
jgi:hypothetical protein